jgi:hypothetical protein
MINVSVCKNKFKIYIFILLCLIIFYLIFFIKNNLIICQDYSVIRKNFFHSPVDCINNNEVVPDAKKNGIEVFKGKHWLVTRDYPNDTLSVAYKLSELEKFKDAHLPQNWLERSYPMLIREGADGALWLAIYDTIDNIPSGKRIDKTLNGISIYRLRPNDEVVIERFANNLEMGGFDTHLYGVESGGKFHVCGLNRCYSVGADGYRQNWELESLSKYEFIEVSVRDAAAVAIIRKKYDDRIDAGLKEGHSEYSIAEFTHTGNVKINQVKKGIPWGVKIGASNYTYSIAETADEFKQLFKYDLSRLAFENQKDLGANNLEGRIAWSQFYYLNSIISLFNPNLKWLMGEADEALRNRLEKEIKLLINLCREPYPGFLVSRYSLNRKPLQIALHHGRVAELLERVNPILSSDFTKECRQILSDRLTKLDDTLEERFDTNTDDGAITSYLRFKKGEDFWADGINVPYNYVSSIAGGLLSIDERNVNVATEYMSSILKNEFSITLPKTWRYWWGVGDKGWSKLDNYSFNTPLYIGNSGGLAHITYRTTDALTLLKISSMSPDTIPSELVNHFKILTKTGWLLPSMNEYWVNSSSGEIDIDYLIARKFSRSASIWELQSQVWAINSLVHKGIK